MGCAYNTAHGVVLWVVIFLEKEHLKATPFLLSRLLDQAATPVTLFDSGEKILPLAFLGGAMGTSR